MCTELTLAQVNFLLSIPLIENESTTYSALMHSWRLALLLILFIFGSVCYAVGLKL